MLVPFPIYGGKRTLDGSELVIRNSEGNYGVKGVPVKLVWDEDTSELGDLTVVRAPADRRHDERLREA